MEGRIRRLEYDVSEEVEYKCNSGYELIGKPQVCAQNGTWIGKVPKCQGNICLFELFGGA